ncbi:hypothetical protein HJC23_013385 [Cyclotella cryptica]|uniref:DUF6824 domain-containing protein n=1 Tax=Cyclotella cryptica TaxID=29204 RepID=A0ABD3PY00_9STRA
MADNEKNGVTMLSIIAAAAETVSLQSLRNENAPIRFHGSNVISSTEESATNTNTENASSGSAPSAIGIERASSSGESSSPSRSKLVLPDMTPDVRKDLESGRGSSSDLPLSISKRPEWADYRLKDILNPHPNDVRNAHRLSYLSVDTSKHYLLLVCGRGGGSNNHPGNEAFRVLVNEVKLPYVNCPKREKPLIARRIVEAVRNQSPPGRFLQKDCKTGLWNDIGDGKAREKTSQALREGAPVIRDMIGKPSVSTADPGLTAGPTKTLDNVAAVSKGKRKAVSSPKTAPTTENAEKVPEALLAATKAYREHVNQPQPSLSAHMVAERRSSLPPSKRFYARGEQESCPSNYPPAPTPWQLQHHAGVSSYRPPPHENIDGRFAGCAAPPTSMHLSQHHHRRASMEYTPSHMRFSVTDSIPYETVRGLLLGHVDPVKLAYQILPPDDAAAVARLHFLGNTSAMASTTIARVRDQPSDPVNSITNGSRPLPLCSLVSDGSSSPADSQSVKEEVPSSDDSSRQSNSERAKAVLPKKKRKFVV